MGEGMGIRWFGGAPNGREHTTPSVGVGAQQRIVGAVALEARFEGSIRVHRSFHPWGAV
jgi:hypothetical protein